MLCNNEELLESLGLKRTGTDLLADSPKKAHAIVELLNIAAQKIYEQQQQNQANLETMLSDLMLN